MNDFIDESVDKMKAIIEAERLKIKKFDEADKIAVVHARQELMEQGLDYGPWSIYYFLVDTDAANPGTALNADDAEPATQAVPYAPFADEDEVGTSAVAFDPFADEDDESDEGSV